MEKLFQDSLSDFVTFITETLKEGKGFVLTNAPTFVQELITYKRIVTLAEEIAFLCVILVIFAICKKFLKDNENDWECFSEDLLLIFAIIIMVVCVALFITNLTSVFKWWVSPNIALIEYISALVKA